MNSSHKSSKHYAGLLIKSILIGVAAGLVASLYRYVLTYGEGLSNSIYSLVRNNLHFMPILFIGLALLGYVVGLLTKHYPLISGSGIPQVKAQMTGYIKRQWLSTLIAKFIGGSLAIVGGLSLGREGPSIQLGACVADGMAEKMSKDLSEKRMFLASGASAGLAGAFNAPLAGVMFALEEVFKYFSPNVLLSTMVAAISADFVSKLFFGTGHIFHFEITDAIPIRYYWIFLVMGLLLGLGGGFYNICLLKTQALYDKLTFIDARFKIIIPFLIAGVLGLTFPIVLGGGHAVVGELHLHTGIGFLFLILLIKFCFSMFSFGSGSPGGIFFPLLILGATIGAIFAKIAIPYLGLNEALFANFIIIAMAGYFTAIVRAPLTGIILMIEMTGALSQLLPLIITSAIAYMVAEFMTVEPIYESLLEKLLVKSGVKKQSIENEKILIETIIQVGSPLENRPIRDLDLSQHCLIVSIIRGVDNITPNGDTVIMAFDRLQILTSVEDEIWVRSQIESYATSA